MFSTKPIAESGWTREWPTETGFYWTREHPHDTTPILVEVRRNHLTICGEAIRCDVREAFEASEFLGPVTSSDFEQLIRLRKETLALVRAAQFSLSTPGLIRGRDQLANAMEAASVALTPKGEQS